MKIIILTLNVLMKFITATLS